MDSSSPTIVKKFSKGGEFIIRESTLEETFIPEERNEEQQMIRDTIVDFIKNEWTPVREKIEKMEAGAASGLLDKAAELGLLGAHMPLEYGGMELDTNTNTMICEDLGTTGSFTVSFAAHTGIGMLPILYFGTPAQKEHYLPDLISGKLKACYCLTEPSSGSDALAAKTTAVLSEDGKHYILNGQKMWISNSGFADIFIVFAQIDGEHFTGFIVEKGAKGMTLGAEEDKMGIKGSSTRQVFFENTKIPVENILGEIGKGHLIAFNALNNGRFKLGALCLGGAKGCITMAVKYANERVQFKVPISTFGAIQYKLAEQAIRAFGMESAQYRISNLLQLKKAELQAQGVDFAAAKLKAAEEYSIECALLKIAGSEMLDYVADENVQVHGGLGFSEEYMAARAYRDSRINRIYEGTNEINRLLMVQMLLRKAMKGGLDIAGPAWAVQKELASMPGLDKPEGKYGEEKKAVSNFKKIILMVAGAAVKMQLDKKLNLKNEQEVMMNIADMMTDCYIAESTLMRVEKLQGLEKTQPQEAYDAMLKCIVHDTNFRMWKNATDALGSFAEEDLLNTFLLGVKRFTKYPPQNVKALRRSIAAVLIKANEYCF